MSDLDVHLPAIQAGDAQAFGRWMSGAEGSLRRSLGSFARQVDVEAVLQESLLRVWQVAPRFEPDGRANGLLRLAHRIARNLAISELRRTRTTPVEPALLAEGLSETERVEARPPDPMLREAVRACRDKLPKKPRAAIDGRIEARGSAHDVTVAARLGMSRNTFLQNVTRARKLLVECLRKRGVVLEVEHV